MNINDVEVHPMCEVKAQQELTLNSIPQPVSEVMNRVVIPDGNSEDSRKDEAAATPFEMERVQQDELALARSAAKAFCATFNFPADKISQLDGPPVFEPGFLERDGQPVVAYRWLGGGRGDYYVQVETYQDNDQVVVYGGYSHQEFGPWRFQNADAGR